MNGARMNSSTQNWLSPQVIVGVFLAFLGIVFTLDNLGFVATDRLTPFWPLFPVAVGVAILMHAQERSQWVTGTVWLVGGGVLLMQQLGLFGMGRYSLRDFMPLFLVWLGVHIIYKRRHSPGVPPPEGVASSGRSPWDPADSFATPESTGTIPPPVPPIPPYREPGAIGADAVGSSAYAGQGAGSGAGSGGSGFGVPGGAGQARGEESWKKSKARMKEYCARPADGAISMFTLMGQVVRKHSTPGFPGANMAVMMGGLELDLRQTTIEERVAYIDCFCMWGGIEVYVPPGWRVVNEAVALMAGVEDKTAQTAIGNPTLVIRGFVLMGGLEIKN